MDDWNIHHDMSESIPAKDLAGILAMAEACQRQIPIPRGTWSHDCYGWRLTPADDGLREYRSAIDWYVRGGFDCINPILRRSDPSKLKLPGHRNQKWLRERVRKDVRAIDAAPHVVLDHDLTLYRGVKYSQKRRLPEPGKLLRDRAYTSCSMRSDVMEQAALRYVALEDYRPYFDLRLEIVVPAGMPVLPVYWYVLHGGQTSMYLPMEINEAEILLGRNVDLRITHAKAPTKAGVIHARAICEARKVEAPSSEIMPIYEHERAEGCGSMVATTA